MCKRLSGCVKNDIVVLNLIKNIDFNNIFYYIVL